MEYVLRSSYGNGTKQAKTPRPIADFYEKKITKGGGGEGRVNSLENTVKIKLGFLELITRRYRVFFFAGTPLKVLSAAVVQAV